jgi:hypothetical protein
MSLRVVNLDNRPFYSVVKQIIKKEAREREKKNIAEKTLTEKSRRGWMDFE